MRVRLSREEELLGTAGGVNRLARHFDHTFPYSSRSKLLYNYCIEAPATGPGLLYTWGITLPMRI